MSITGDPKPAFDGVSTVNANLEQNPQIVNMLPSNSGLYHTNVPMKDLKFNIGKGESVINHRGCYITMGGDRPGSIFTGLGAKGFSGTDTIDLCVGRGANARGGKGVAEGSVVNNMFSSDASRIYISQLTHVDKNFGIAPGVHQNTKQPRAAIAMKSDDVRIIGRNSIKIITGRGSGVRGHGDRGEPNALGGKSMQAPAIELIAGNYDEASFAYGGLYNTPEKIPYLQAAIKGENLEACLQEMMDIVGNLWSAVFNIALTQAGYNAVVGIDPVRPWVATAAAGAGMLMNTFALKALWATRVKCTTWEFLYLRDSGYRCIKSPNVFLT
tara:strand:- start:571 stop:1551 length:981 start_codon:yes stop_codon:yes gene_type:complete